MQKKILIVDDEELIVEALVDLFNGSEFSATGANSGNGAIELCEDTQFDIVISDVRMEDGDGLMLAKWLFEKYEKDVPVVFVTGYLNESKEGLPDNVIDVLKKPIKFAEFVPKVREFLS